MERDRQPLEPKPGLHAALAAAAPLWWPTLERDNVWLAAWACATGSMTRQEVGGDEVRRVELLTATSCLFDHARIARLIGVDALFRMRPNLAVRGGHGFARATQADPSHGLETRRG